MLWTGDKAYALQWHNRYNFCQSTRLIANAADEFIQ
jgi:hypothetical protein